MATNCDIGIINTDGSIDLIYCHHDGYPSYQTPILLNHYNTEEKIRELINLGNISCLHDNIKPSKTTHSFDNPETNVVIAYHRDKKENWDETKPLHFESKTEMMQNIGGGYKYLYDSIKQTWTYTSNQRFRTLTKPINK